MNKEIRQILENQTWIMLNISSKFSNSLEDKKRLINNTERLLSQEESKELPTEMPEEDEE